MQPQQYVLGVFSRYFYTRVRWHPEWDKDGNPVTIVVTATLSRSEALARLTRIQAIRNCWLFQSDILRFLSESAVVFHSTFIFHDLS